MKMPRLTPTRGAALLLIILGIVGLFAGDPYHRSTATVDTRELAAIVERQVDHVTAAELADWIIQGRTDFRLIDLRTEEEYASYHIPQAERVPITALMDYGLQRNEKIVLYSEGGIHSAQAWMLLKAQGYRGVYMLLGGLDAWTDEVLFPGLPADASAQERAAFERAVQVSRFFGGTPREGAQERSVTSAMPPPPPPQAVTPSTAKPKKRKEGC
jgi:hypothetical protein